MTLLILVSSNIISKHDVAAGALMRQVVAVIHAEGHAHAWPEDATDDDACDPLLAAAGFVNLGVYLLLAGGALHMNGGSGENCRQMVVIVVVIDDDCCWLLLLHGHAHHHWLRCHHHRLSSHHDRLRGHHHWLSVHFLESGYYFLRNII